MNMKNIKSYTESLQEGSHLRGGKLVWAVANSRTNEIEGIYDTEKEALEAEREMVHEEGAKDFSEYTSGEGMRFRGEDAYYDALSDYLDNYTSDDIYVTEPFDPSDPEDDYTEDLFRMAKKTNNGWTVLDLIERGANPLDHFKNLDELLGLVHAMKTTRFFTEESKQKMKEKLERMWKGRSAFGM